jgi:hypothetical protein
LLNGKVVDLTGPGLTSQFGVTCTDLGASVTAPNGKLVSVFGDTFSGRTVGQGDWRSPVVLIGTGDADHEIVYERAGGESSADWERGASLGFGHLSPVLGGLKDRAVRDFRGYTKAGPCRVGRGVAAPASHGSGRAQLRHPARRRAGSLRVLMDNDRRRKRVALQQPT